MRSRSEKRRYISIRRATRKLTWMSCRLSHFNFKGHGAHHTGLAKLSITGSGSSLMATNSPIFRISIMPTGAPRTTAAAGVISVSCEFLSDCATTRISGNRSSGVFALPSPAPASHRRPAPQGEQVKMQIYAEIVIAYYRCENWREHTGRCT